MRTCFAYSFMVGNFSIIRLLILGFCTSRVINFQEEPFGIIKLDASSHEAGQDSGDVMFGSEDGLQS